MLIYSLLANLQKALLVNSAQDTYQTSDQGNGLPLGPTHTEPSGAGVFELGGRESVEVPNRVFLAPYGQGTPGQAFGLRLYGWSVLTQRDDNPQTQVWLPFLIVELYAALSQQAGPQNPTNGPSPFMLSDTERMADYLTVLGGTLGLGGYLNTQGFGTNLLGYAFCDVAAFRYLQFDFQQGDQAEVAMNCLWRFA